MNEKGNEKRKSIKISKTLHARLKSIASLKEMSLVEFLEQALWKVAKESR